MYAVIFTAELNKPDATISTLAHQLRQLAMEKYGCIDFITLTQGSKELSISYWESMEQIERWKQNQKHIEAQELGRDKLYKSYHVQIVEIIREYHGNR